MIEMKLVFTEKEKVCVNKLAKLIDFPLEKFISSDGFTIYLKQSVVLQKLAGYIRQCENLPGPFRHKIRKDIITKLNDELPGGFVRK